MQKISSLTTSVILAVTPIFCGGQIPAREQEQMALDSFKSLVHRHVESYGPNGGGHSQDHIIKVGKKWAKAHYTIESPNFNAVKTDSLVTPFLGTFKFTIIMKRSVPHNTQAEAEADTVLKLRLSTYHTHTFAYQEDKWQPKDRHYTLAEKADIVGPNAPRGIRDLEEEMVRSRLCDRLLVTGVDERQCLEEFDNK
jgi:hypothetical protein